jgi:hypothetical protein
MLLKGLTLTRLRGSRVEDGYGGSRLDWSNPQTITIPGCAMAPVVEDEIHTAGRSAAVAAWTVYAPWADVEADDRVDTPHGLYEVDGDPGRWESLYTGRKPGMTFRLRRVGGDA